MEEEDERPVAVLALQYALIAQALFDIALGLGFGAYYGWAMTMAARAHVVAPAAGVVGGVVPAVVGLVGAALGAVSAYGLASRQPWAWLVGLGVAAVHLVLNPCCSPLSLILVALFVLPDVRDWLD